MVPERLGPLGNEAMAMVPGTPAPVGSEGMAMRPMRPGPMIVIVCIGSLRRQAHHWASL